jgi:tripartite-type tricarboxylate transporter receptor subunit TctC
MLTGIVWLAALFAWPALGQNFPNRPITIVVPFPPGGPIDVAGRLMAQALGTSLGQPVVVENQGAGAGGSVGTARVARAAPDGHTLLAGAPYLSGARAFLANLAFDPAADFAPIGLLYFGPTVLMSRNDLALPPGEAGVAVWLRQAGDRAIFAHAGLSTVPHQCALVLLHRIGAAPTLVSYRGAGPAMQDLMAGNVDLLCLPTTAALPFIRAGQARALLTTGPARAAALPEVPTAAEALPPRGDAGAEVLQWAGLLAPVRTPPAIIMQLSRALAAALDDPTLLARITALGAEPFPPQQRTPEAMAALLAADTATIANAARSMGVRPE